MLNTGLWPTDMTVNTDVKLRNVRTTLKGGVLRLEGECIGHPVFDDGRKIVTSPISWQDPCPDGNLMVGTTSDSNIVYNVVSWV